MTDLKIVLQKTIKDFIVDGILMFMGSTPHSKDDPKFINIANLIIQDEATIKYTNREMSSRTYLSIHLIKQIYYRYYARLYNIFQQHIGQTDDCYNNMDASLIFPVLFNINYYKCIPPLLKGKLGECNDILKDILGPNKFNNLIELMYQIQKENERRKDETMEEEENSKEDFTDNSTIHEKYKKCSISTPCPSGDDCDSSGINVLYLKVLSVVKDFEDELDENSTRDLFDNKNNEKLSSHINFIDNLSLNIANEMVGETNLVCKNYLSNTQEGFVGNFQENQSNKIMKAVLFALLFYILNSKQVQSILKKILKVVYKTYSTEHLLIISMIVFAILYYVVNLFI